MRRVAGVCVLLLVLVALTGCNRTGKGVRAPDAAPGSVPDLTGAYVVNGLVSSSGAEYGGALRISPGAGSGEYRLDWILNESIQEGEGTVKGNRLEATWRTISSAAGPQSGVVTYTITERGELYGTRRSADTGWEGEETAWPNR
jgi:hypothetical protein